MLLQALLPLNHHLVVICPSHVASPAEYLTTIARFASFVGTYAVEHQYADCHSFWLHSGEVEQVAVNVCAATDVLPVYYAGPYEVAGPGGLARATSGMRNLGDTGSSSLYRLGSLAALSPGFLGISAPAAPRR